ncbi:MAG: PH domain-containing protein [Chloroflexi bacterium]|nr:PH domain-containing protein [Chloroflexota bacterium]
MHFAPVRAPALAIHLSAGLGLCAVLGVGLWRLLGATLNWQSAVALLGVAVAITGLPVVVTRLIALARGGYKLDSQALTLHWGGDLEVVPLDHIVELRTGGGIAPGVRRRVGARSGWSRARFTPEDGQRVEAFATSSAANLVLVVTSHGAWALSPADLPGFVDAFSRLSAVISAEKADALSYRRPTLARELLGSRFAQVVVATTSIGLLLLMMMLLAVQPALLREHPFTFDAAGVPAGLGSPARLLLLPFFGMMAWLLDLGLGWVAVRRRDYVAAYMVMGVGLMTTVGLWIGVLTLLRFA